jgi:hypothetical protein
VHVKEFQAMFDVPTVVETISIQEDSDRGHDDDHQESLHGDLASSISPPEVCSQGCNRDNCNLCDVICGRDARDRIENRHQNWEHEEQEKRDERDYDYYGPYYDPPH